MDARTRTARRNDDERTIQPPPGAQTDVVYEADPDGRPVVHHRVVDSLGRMLNSGTIDQAMFDAARDFQAAFTIAAFDGLRALPLTRVPGNGRPGDLTDCQVRARRRVHEAITAVGGLASPGGHGSESGLILVKVFRGVRGGRRGSSRRVCV